MELYISVISEIELLLFYHFRWRKGEIKIFFIECQPFR
jgi:hypothetical protein